MDVDSSLETIALALSLALYALFSSVEGYLLPGLQSGGTDSENALSARARLLLQNSRVSGLVEVGLIVAVVASGVALLQSFTTRWWSVALGTIAILVLLALVRGVAIGLGFRLKTGTRRFLPLLWPLALSAIPLSKLQSSLTSAFSGETVGSQSSNDPPSTPSNSLENRNSDSHDTAVLDPYERRMISSILKLDQTTAREVMVPRMDILAADVASSLSQVAEMMWDSGHSRIPVFEESVDRIIGVVHSRDLLRNLATGDDEVALSGIIRPPLFIPESKRLDDLLRDFQEKHIQIAIVVDEYGGVAGLVTIEDLLEEIVGEIEDEFDIGEPMLETLSGNEAIMDARISLDEVNRVFSANLQGEGFDTLGGLLYHHLGKIPVPGDEVLVDGLAIKVVSTLGRRVKKVQVVKSAPSDSPISS